MKKTDIIAGTKFIIEGKEYTVIENVQGTQYKVLASELARNGTRMRFGSNNDYEGSIVATCLDSEYYDSLPEKIKNAIVETEIQQKVISSYEYGKNSPIWTGKTKNVGTHKIFLPSWDEFIKAAGSSDSSTLEMFLNDKNIWLRDTFENSVFGIMFYGYLCNTSTLNYHCVRPAFVLDISKVCAIVLLPLKRNNNSKDSAISVFC